MGERANGPSGAGAHRHHKANTATHLEASRPK